MTYTISQLAPRKFNYRPTFSSDTMNRSNTEQSLTKNSKVTLKTNKIVTLRKTTGQTQRKMTYYTTSNKLKPSKTQNTFRPPFSPRPVPPAGKEQTHIDNAQEIAFHGERWTFKPG